jgi:glyoxylase-like metal-dependent hydrolase (beta-lactamase superfamily II)
VTVSPDVLSLGNEEFEGDNSSYVLRGDGETALVDTGVSTPETKKEFVEGLGSLGVDVSGIDAVFVTHWHADHSGLAGYVQEESGAEVYVHERDAPLVERYGSAWEDMGETQRELIADWGVPDAKRDALLSFIDGMEGAYGEPPEVERFEGGESFGVAGVELEAFEAPGHTEGLTCFAAGGVVFTGDALLPVYTPNVGGADVRVDKPLERYLDTLTRIAGRGFGRAYPGHRGRIEEPTERALEIVEHHRDRAGRVLGVLREDGPLNAWEVGARLFGELNGIHILHGPGESYAHLDHMEDAGVVTSERCDDGTVRYSVASEEDGDERLRGVFPGRP